MSSAGVFLLLLLAILCGYIMGIYQRKGDIDETDEPQSDKQDLLKSLGYLLREEPDAGLDQFIHRLDVTPATLDTHLAVGSLLRRKGEVSRAIRVHQNLLSRPSLSKSQQQLAQIELAQDFAQAGLLDRAERLLIELFQASDEARERIAELLVDIYQDEREWQKAIDVVNQLGKGWFAKLPEHWQAIRAHFYCELAASEVAGGDLVKARRLLKQARQQILLPRSLLLTAEIDVLAGEYRHALGSLEQLAAVNIDQLYAGMPLLVALAKHEPLKPAVLRLLQQAWRETGIAAFVLAELELATGRSEAERQSILELAIKDRPNLRLLNAYLSMLAAKGGEIASLLEPLSQMAKRLNAMPHYKCQQCGFSGKQVHWLCPSCKSWGSLLPIKGLEGV